MAAAANAGRTPKPPTLRIIEGRGNGRDSGGRPVAEPPAFKRLPPTPPEWLPPEAAAEWARVVPELSRLDLVKPVDRASLTAYVLTWDRLVAASKMVKDEGLLHDNSQGRVRHPAVAVIEAASKELRAWCSEFGLTPAAEGKVGRRPDDDADQSNPYG